MKKLYVVLVVGFFMYGCSSLQWRPNPDYVQLAVSNNVEVFRTKPEKSFKELGIIEVGANSKNACVEKAINQAKKVGADAIFITSEITNPPQNTFDSLFALKAIALKYK
ncbi:MAG: hypothetical protein PHE88_09600 [Elusimicrobia bacterium]|nr:hypothetical protein [Elusimicrobiota bacterium]